MTRAESQPEQHKEVEPRSRDELDEAERALSHRARLARITERQIGATPEWYDNLPPEERIRIARVIQSAITLGELKGVAYARGQSNEISGIVDQRKKDQRRGSGS